jgi:hypothetical protein
MSTPLYISESAAVKMHYLNSCYQILLVMKGNSLMWPMIKYHLDEKLFNEVAHCSAAWTRGCD